MDVGCYPISFANLIFGELPERVKAAGVYRLDSPTLTLRCAEFRVLPGAACSV